jgi:hypothetical protein
LFTSTFSLTQSKTSTGGDAELLNVGVRPRPEV